MYVNATGRIVTRKRIKEWVTIYEDRDGNRIKIRGFKRPTKTRVFRVASKPGRRKFTAISAKHQTKELILVAKNKGKKKKEEELDEEELEELEDLEDLDDLEDEDEDVEDDDSDEDEDSDEEDEDEEEDDEDEDDEDEEDEDEDDDEEDDEEEEEAPAPKKSKKSKSKKGKKGKSRASANNKIGVPEVAEAAGTDGRTLRMVLRKHGVEKDEETNRYEWSSLKHPEVKKIIKWVKERGEGRKVKEESLKNLKNRKTKKTKKKKTKKS